MIRPHITYRVLPVLVKGRWHGQKKDLLYLNPSMYFLILGPAPLDRRDNLV